MRDSNMVTRTFLRLLPIQIMLVAVASPNSLVNMHKCP